MITVDQFKALFPQAKNVEALVSSMNLYFPKYEINTKDRICHFLSQCGHESAGFTTFMENLNYSGERLLVVFPKYFNQSLALTYARNPEKIANHVYSNRLGNGNEASGDGWKYRGRGYIQLTGKDNYTNFGISIGKKPDEAASYCETVNGALESSLWFWSSRKLNRFADANDIDGLTKAINGGLNGLDDRTNLFNKAQTIF